MSWNFMKLDIFQLWRQNWPVNYRKFEKVVGYNQLDNLVMNLKLKTREKYVMK